MTTAALLALASLGAAGYALFGPPGLYARSEASASCLACHAEAGSVGTDGASRTALFDGSHGALACVECHLPGRSLLQRVAWQAIDRTRDRLLHLSGSRLGRAVLRPHGRVVALDNCRRCHARQVSEASPAGECLFCHRRLRHVSASPGRGGDIP